MALSFVGSYYHATELTRPDGVVTARVLCRVQVYRTLTSRMESIPGAKVEHNKFCLSVHFRCVQEEVCLAIAVCLLQSVCFLGFFCFPSYFYACVLLSRQEWESLNKEVRSVLKEYPDLRLTHGRKVSISYLPMLRRVTS
jgi:hypothetical protein